MLAAALVAGLVSFAATTPAAAATRWYHVEVVLFAQGADDAAWRRNDWREEGPPALAKNTVELLPGLDADGLPDGSNRRHAFRTLPPSALDLGAVADRLDRSNDYRVLLHVGWNQPGFSDDEAPAVHLGTLGALAGAEERSAGTGGEEVEGAIRFWRRRFLHVDVDLSFGDIEAWRERKAGSALARPGGESTDPGLATAGARTGTAGAAGGGLRRAARVEAPRRATSRKRMRDARPERTTACASCGSPEAFACVREGCTTSTIPCSGCSSWSGGSADASAPPLRGKGAAQSEPVERAAARIRRTSRIPRSRFA